MFNFLICVVIVATVCYFELKPAPMCNHRFQKRGSLGRCECGQWAKLERAGAKLDWYLIPEPRMARRQTDVHYI